MCQMKVDQEWTKCSLVGLIMEIWSRRMGPKETLEQSGREFHYYVEIELYYSQRLSMIYCSQLLFRDDNDNMIYIYMYVYQYIIFRFHLAVSIIILSTKKRNAFVDQINQKNRLPAQLMDTISI